MLSIHPQYLPLAKLLDGRLFRIPEYQRAYSWTSQQRKDLFDDIEKVHTKGIEASHFMAAVVCLRRGRRNLGTDEYDIVEVVDGQQRLTTLIILLKSIALGLDRDDRAEGKLARELDELLVKVDGGELLLLQTNHDSSHFFETYLLRGAAPAAAEGSTIADRELLLGIEECKRFVARWLQSGKKLPDLAALLKNRLSFLLHEMQDERTVYTVFEVLNSRGLEVAWLDRLKSILMGTAFELQNGNVAALIEELHGKWRAIYAVMGLRQGLSSEALRYAATLRAKEAPSRSLGEKDSVDLLRGEATNAKKVRHVAQWLLRVAEACDVTVSNQRINAVTRIAQARLLAVAIHLRDDFSGRERESLLARWERVTFRIYGMMGHDARTRVGEYSRLAWRVVNEDLSAREISKAIGEIGEKFTIEDAIKALRNENCYDGWQNELRYLMFRYEEHLARAQKLNFSNEQWARIWLASAADSIEHIWAQSAAPDAVRHRLGNLVLLPPNLNSTLQDLAPKDKVTAYRRTGLLIAGEVADRIEAGRWNSRAVEDREEAMLEWAATEWAD